jgi:Na+-transporting NADH:ubiquinone oxidoreductase subunit B
MTGWLLDPHRWHNRPAWTPARITLVQLMAMTPPVAVTIVERGPAQFAILVVALLVSLGWELGFALVRRRPPSWHGASVAMIFAVMAPADTALWQVALALSFGVVFGELVFGGRGYGFLSAAAAALGFFVFSFSGATLPSGGLALAMAATPGAALLIAAGLASWRVLLAAAIVVVSASLWATGAGGFWQPLAGILFGLVFLIADPTAAASTNLGRWIYGALAGALIVLFDPAPGPLVEPAAVVFAALLASVFAPLIDFVAVELNVRRRRAKHG